MNLKKLSAVFISIAIFVTMCIPMAVSAADTDTTTLKVTVSATPDEMTSVAAVNVLLFVSVENLGSNPVIIKSIEIRGNFIYKSETPISESIGSKSSTIFPITTSFSGRTNLATIIVTTSTDKVVTSNTRVSEITPYTDLGGGGGSIGGGGSDSGGGGGSTGGGDGTVVETDPKVYVFSMDSTVFMAGDTIPVPMTISTEDGYADDVRLKLSGGAPETVEKFSFFSSTGWLAAGDITTMLDVTPYIQVHPSVADGTYPVVIDFNYTRHGKTYTNQSKMNFVVQGRSNTVPYIKSANFTHKEIGKENKSNLVVNVTNPSAGVFTDVSIAFKPGEDKRFSLSDTIRSLTINTLEPLNSSSVSFPMYIDTEVKTGNYPLTFTMSYKDSSGAVLTSNETVYAQVTRSADADGKDSTPRIIVSKYSSDVEVIKAGQAFTLDFTLKNTSSKSAIGNLKVVIDSTVISGTGTGANANSGAVFFPAEGSNSFFIASIASGGEKSETIKLMAKQDVEPGVYPVLLKLDYEDAEGKPLSSTEQISFSVAQEQRLDVQALTIPTDGMAGSPIPINFQYINKGKATISNLSVTVEGDFTLEGGSQYIGNLTAGYNDYFDNVVVTTKEGALKGEIVLKYEDSTGGEVEKRTPFEINVMAGGGMGGGEIIGGGGMVPGMGGGIEPMPETKSPLTTILWIGIPALAVVVGVLAFIIIKKKRKAKRELVEDEED